MAIDMTDVEWRTFVTQGTRTAALATVRRDGRPHVAPIWFVLDDDGSVVFTTGADTVKGTSLRRDPRVSLCIDDPAPPFAFVLIEGVAAISTDLDEMLPLATKIGGRYMGADRADGFGRRNAVEGELLVRVTPTRVIARKDIAD
jgi:PPOX class probable F420-dependent enzyme